MGQLLGDFEVAITGGFWVAAGDKSAMVNPAELAAIGRSVAMEYLNYADCYRETLKTNGIRDKTGTTIEAIADSTG